MKVLKAQVLLWMSRLKDVVLVHVTHIRMDCSKVQLLLGLMDEEQLFARY